MSEPLEIDKPYVERRVNNWIKKVEELYTLVETTVENYQGIEYKLIDNMIMYEEPMAKFGIPPKNVPILDLYQGKKLIATFKPVGLWVIGAKGKIDILTKAGSFILINVAEDENQPEWQVFTPKNRKKSESFNPKFIDKLLNLQ